MLNLPNGLLGTGRPKVVGAKLQISHLKVKKSCSIHWSKIYCISKGFISRRFDCMYNCISC